MSEKIDRFVERAKRIPLKIDGEPYSPRPKVDNVMAIFCNL